MDKNNWQTDLFIDNGKMDRQVSIVIRKIMKVNTLEKFLSRPQENKFCDLEIVSMEIQKIVK